MGIRAIYIIGIIVLVSKNADGIYMLDVGQGDCIVAINRGNAYIMDGGSTSRNRIGENVIIPFLKSEGVNNVACIFVSHPDEDHMNGMLELIEMSKEECIKIKRIAVYNESLACKEFDELVNIANLVGIEVTGINKGCGFYDKNVSISCLYPERGLYTDENNNSLVLKIELDGITMLETGDLESEGERILEKEQIDADILKVAHHGSSSSSSREFVECISPKLALISAGRNNRYGHPHRETIELLEEMNIPYLCTQDTGAIYVRNKRNGIVAENYIKN